MPYIKDHTVETLINFIYEDNFSHFDFMENMNGGDCDCSIHTTMNTIISYEELLDNASVTNVTPAKVVKINTNPYN
jgi:hypothetical protein